MAFDDPNVYGRACVSKKNSSRMAPHTAVLVCCADGSAIEPTPTTQKRREMEISNILVILKEYNCFIRLGYMIR